MVVVVEIVGRRGEGGSDGGIDGSGKGIHSTIFFYQIFLFSFFLHAPSPHAHFLDTKRRLGNVEKGF